MDAMLLVNNLLDTLDNVMASIENDQEVKELALSYWDLCFIKHCIEAHMKESEVKGE